MENEFARRKEAFISGRTFWFGVALYGALVVLAAAVVGGIVPPTTIRIACEANSAVSARNPLKEINVELLHL